MAVHQADHGVEGADAPCAASPRAATARRGRYGRGRSARARRSADSGRAGRRSALAQEVGARRHRGALAVVEPRRRGIELRRQLPDPLRLAAGRDAGDIGGGGGRPVEPRQRVLGRRRAAAARPRARPSTSAVSATWRQEQREARSGRARSARAGARFKPRVAVGHAERQARDALRAQSRSAGPSAGKRWWFGIEAEAPRRRRRHRRAGRAPRRRGRGRDAPSSSGQSLGTVTSSCAKSATPSRVGQGCAARQRPRR